MRPDVRRAAPGRPGATGLGLLALAGTLLLSACGGGEDTPGQPSADERRSLDNIARKMDEQGTIDTSPDSMVPADEAAVSGNGAANEGAPAAAVANSAALGNAAAPR